MKKIEKNKARELRLQGLSLNEIKSRLDVSKGSISLWVRDIKLTQKQKKELSMKGLKKEIIEKRRETRLSREKEKRQILINKAKTEVRNLSKKDLFHIGIALYWAEGSKTKRGSVEFSNSDSKLIKIMMSFFRNVCEVPKEKFRGHVYLHEHLNPKKAEIYWSDISGIPLSQFFKTSQQKNKASLNKKDNLPYGTFAIGVYDVKLFLKIIGWMEAIYENTIDIKWR